MTSQSSFESPRLLPLSQTASSGRVGPNNCWSRSTSHNTNRDLSPRKTSLEAHSCSIFPVALLPGDKSISDYQAEDSCVCVGLISQDDLPPPCSGSRLQAHGGPSETHAAAALSPHWVLIWSKLLGFHLGRSHKASP